MLTSGGKEINMAVDKRKLFVQILSVCGFLLTIKLAMIYYNANYVKYSLSSFCSINDFVDCDGASRTKFSQVMGIPLAYWGMMFYLTVLFLTFVDKLKNIKFLKFLSVFKNPMSYIAVLGTLAFICSLILAGISIFTIKKLCILCFITYFIDLAIALVAVKGWRGYFESFKTTVLDFIDGAKTYPKTFVVLLILAVSFLSVSAFTDCFLPHVRKTKEFKKYAQMTENPYRINGNVLGNENGDVVIELYSDYVCPLCYIQNIMLHRIAKEYSNVKIIHHNLPFDKECNYEISANMHPGACYMARAALAAEKQGNYWGMSSLLYYNKPVNDEELAPLVEELGLDKDKFFADINSKEINDKLIKDIETTNNTLGIDATPTMYVNGDKHTGVMVYKELEAFLVEHGAKKR